MKRNSNSADPWTQAIVFWSGLWQAQIETSLRFWAGLAGRFPHESAATLAAEAEALKARQPGPASQGRLHTVAAPPQMKATQPGARSAQPAKTRSSATTM